MNTQEDINSRLLMLYPVREVKNHFNLKGLQPEVIKDIVKNRTTTDIYDFAFSNHDYSKQHVYIYEIANFQIPAFNQANAHFPFQIYNQPTPQLPYTLHLCPLIVYTATVIDTSTGGTAKVTMNFPQPIVITITNYHLIIKATIIEKDIASYMQSGKTLKAFGVTKDNDDDYNKIIYGHFSKHHGCTPCDINKGVKYLCDNDIIDFRELQFLNANSTDKVIMNEEFTFKDKYPKEYANVMKSPLTKSIFKYLLNDDALCRHFVADPNIGIIGISLYPDDVTQINNVIDTILANN